LFGEREDWFPEIRYFEDPVFLARIMWKSGRFVVVDVDYYCYVLSPKPRMLTEEQCLDLVCGLGKNLEFAKQYNLDILRKNTYARLVYEYGDWIYRYAQESEELRWQIQRFGLSASDGARLLERGYKRDYATYVHERIRECGIFYLYGNGEIAHKFFKYAESAGLEECFGGFVVTNVNCLDVDRVQSVADYAESQEKGLLIVAVSGVYIAEIVEILKQKQITNYEILDLCFMSELYESMGLN
jgi:hypothetical protein